jgi:hypothetical protein
MANIIRNPKYWETDEGKMVAMQNNGRRAITTAASWVTDLAELKKCICLCHLCTPKFNPKAYRYERQTRPPLRNVVGECDGCKATNEQCAVFMPE